MKIKTLIMTLVMLLSCVVLAACGEKTKEPTEEPAPASDLVIWVGSESVKFYEKVMVEYEEAYKTKNGKDFPGNIKVIGMDTGSAADSYLNDTEAGADIFTVAHDNLGKLLAGSGKIAAIKSKSLLDQMESTNPDAFLDVCYLQAEDGSSAQYYAAPIISQALVLYYNKEIFAGKEAKLATWEGIMEVAAENNAMATSFSGTDGFNYSCFLLAQPYSEDAIAAFGKQGTLQIYKGGVQANCMGYGDDQVAISKWAQRFILHPNGRNKAITSSDKWSNELTNGKAITMVGGAWHLNNIKAALGDDNYGVVELPRFTLTEADAYGKAKAGMVFHSGSFFDAKCLVKKADSEWAEYLDDIIEFLTSDDIQERSYKECANLPASMNIEIGADDPLGAAQLAQTKYGMAQPFGFKQKFNTYYYSKGAPDLYVAIHQNTKGEYETDAAILAKLQEASYIWAKGKNPSNPEELAAWVASK